MKELAVKELAANKSILDAIRDGIWDYEPSFGQQDTSPCTRALPGTREKVEILATRALQGLPLWHNGDRLCYDESRDY